MKESNSQIGKPKTNEQIKFDKLFNISLEQRLRNY